MCTRPLGYRKCILGLANGKPVRKIRVQNTLFKVAGSFPHKGLETLRTNILVYDITGYKVGGGEGRGSTLFQYPVPPSRKNYDQRDSASERQTIIDYFTMYQIDT